MLKRSNRQKNINCRLLLYQ